MSAAVKLAGFGALVLLVFGGAVVIGGALGPDRDGEATADGGNGHSESNASHGGASAAGKDTTVRGLAVSTDGLTLALHQTEMQRGRPSELRFSVLDSGGQPVRDFEVEHEKRVHLIVVRRDGHGFQHLHPELGEGSVWRVRLTLPEAGSYRVFADFKRGGAARTLAADLSVDGEADYRPLPAAATNARTPDGYEVRLDAGTLHSGREAELRFSVSRNGETVRTEPYLGAGGHLVALRQGDLAYLHVHPEQPGEAVSFMTEFPSAGRYRLYLQFKHEGRIHTAEFTQEVAR